MRYSYGYYSISTDALLLGYYATSKTIACIVEDMVQAKEARQQNLEH